MKFSKNQHKYGFTIIEVVLVLAVAGAIFSMIFIALPALQRAYRDFQRRQDIERLHLAFEQYKDANGGEYPWHSLPTNNDSIRMSAEDTNAFLDSYVKKDTDFKDPSGREYRVTIDRYGEADQGGGTGSELSPARIMIVGDGECRYPDNSSTRKAVGSYAIIGWRELNNGKYKTHCTTYQN